MSRIPALAFGVAVSAASLGAPPAGASDGPRPPAVAFRVVPVAEDREDAVPDEAAVRGRVEALIHSFRREKKKATLGMIHQAIGLSIGYGAPAYNAGDRAGCFRFYARTADDLAEGFPDEAGATDAARGALADLKAARERTRHNADPDRNAWAMRYAFDKAQVAWEAQIVSAQNLIQLGTDNFHESRFPEAQDAYEAASRCLGELDGQPLEQIPVVCRYAPLALANALFAQKRYGPASEAIRAGLHYVPEWPGVALDLRSLHHDRAEYEALREDLEAKAGAAPDDAALQFLLGYEFYYSGRRNAARGQFERTLRIDPQHPGARLFLDFESSPGGKPGGEKPGREKPGEEPAQPFRPGESRGGVKT